MPSCKCFGEGQQKSLGCVLFHQTIGQGSSESHTKLACAWHHQDQHCGNFGRWNVTSDESSDGTNLLQCSGITFGWCTSTWPQQSGVQTVLQTRFFCSRRCLSKSHFWTQRGQWQQFLSEMLQSNCLFA